MPSKWMVGTETDRYDLEWNSYPFWIELKRNLTTGEQKRVTSSGMSYIKSDKDVKGKKEADDRDVSIFVDWDRIDIVKVYTWMTNWSFTDDNDQRIKLTLDAISNLHPKLFDVIAEKVKEHSEKAEKDVVSKKTTGVA